MIIVSGIIEMSEGDVARLTDAMATQMAATQAEDGCIQYDFSHHVTRPDVLIVSEKWRDADALAAHGKAPHMAIFNRAVGKATIKRISVRAYDASNERTLIGE